MRWFIVLLLIANLALFFWLQNDSVRDESVAAPPPPDIGRLELLDLDSPEGRSKETASVTVAGPPSAGAPGEASTPAQPPDTDPVPPAESPAPSVTVQTDTGESETSMVTAATPSSASGSAPRAPEGLDDPSTEAVSAADEAEEGAALVRDEAEAVGAVAAVRAESKPEQIENASPPPAAPTCARVGPLTPEAASALTARMPVFVQLLSEVTEEVDEVDSYYVMIPPLPSRSAGLETLAALEAAGITDTWLFRRGPRRNAISLGVFRQRRIAERRLRNVAAKGFEARLVERTRRREVRQLLVKNLDGGDVALSLPLPDGVTAVPQPCP